MSAFLIDLSRLLQGQTQDILAAYEEIEMIKQQLLDARMKTEEELSAIFQTMIQHHGEDTFRIPRQCG